MVTVCLSNSTTMPFTSSSVKRKDADWPSTETKKLRFLVLRLKFRSVSWPFKPSETISSSSVWNLIKIALIFKRLIAIPTVPWRMVPRIWLLRHVDCLKRPPVHPVPLSLRLFCGLQCVLYDKEMLICKFIIFLHVIQMKVNLKGHYNL